jgi:metal-responsive CopG/Arc/MetJ family transcriptional regulator
MAEKISIRVDLEGDLAKEFEYLKRVKGIKNNSELIRLLIAEEYRRAGGKPLF